MDINCKGCKGKKSIFVVMQTIGVFGVYTVLICSRCDYQVPVETVEEQKIINLNYGAPASVVAVSASHAEIYPRK